MVDFVDYGDTDGPLGGRERAGDQTLATELPPPPSNYDLVRLVGDAEVLAERATGGDDTIRQAFYGVTTVLIGDARIMSNRAQGGDDVIRNNTGVTNTIYGDAEEMSGRTRGGDDVVEAPAPPFTRTAASSDVFGDARTLTGRAVGGDDILRGAIGFEGSTARLYGDGFELRGRTQGGDDRLVSRAYATDEMWGDAQHVGRLAGTGNDVFVFSPGNGSDVIHDFEPGKDRIDLSAFAEAGIGGFEDLEGRIQLQDNGSLIVLDTSDVTGNSVLVAGVHELSSGDFLFG